jgi:hypothetical protein
MVRARGVVSFVMYLNWYFGKILLKPRQSQPPMMYIAIALCLPRQYLQRTLIQPFNRFRYPALLLAAIRGSSSEKL